MRQRKPTSSKGNPRPKQRKSTQDEDARLNAAVEPDTVGFRGWWVQISAIFSLALALRLLHFWFMERHPIYEVLIGDSWQYDRWGQEIAQGDWIGQEVFYQTPLYPYFLGAVYAIFGHSVWAVRIVQAVLGSLSCVVVARAGSGFFGHRAGWLAGLLLAIYPPAIFFDGILQKASLDLLLTCLLLWIISRLSRQLSRWGSLATGLTLGLLILNRENAWLMFPVVVVWLGWRCLVERKSNATHQSEKVVLDASYKKAIFSLGPIGLLVVGMSAVLLPVGFRNYTVGGEFLLTTSQMGPNFYIGNNKMADGGYVELRSGRGHARHEREDARVLAEQAKNRALSPGEVSRYWMRKSMEDIADDPGRWVRLLSWKWFLTWNQIETIDSEGIRVHAEYSPVLRILGWLLNFGVLVAIGVAGAWLTRGNWQRLSVLYALAIVFAASVAIFFVFARYRYPLVPMVILFSAAGLVRMAEVFKSDSKLKWRELSAAGALAAIVAVATCWPVPSMHNDEVTYFNVGTELSSLGRFEEAVEYFNKALEIQPNYVLARINLGTNALREGKWARAEEHFTQATMMAPNNGVAWANLGAALLEQDKDDAGERVLHHALQVDPFSMAAISSLILLERKRGNSAKVIEYLRRAVTMNRQSIETHIDLANALIVNGQLEGAVSALETAMKVDPNQLAVANNLAWILATGPETIRNGQRAIEIASDICQRTEFKSPEFLDTLAAAYAEADDFDQAVEYAKRASSIYVDQGKLENAEEELKRMKGYERSQPYRESQQQVR